MGEPVSFKFDFGRTAAIFKWLAKIADPIQKWATIIALVVGAYWSYNLFIAEDTHAENPEINISTETLSYANDLRLLAIHVHAKNIGKVPIEIQRDHFWISLKSVPKDRKAGYLNLSKLPELDRITDVANVDEGYWLEPGVEYDETRAFVVAPGMYAITAELDYGANTGEEVDVTRIVLAE